MLNNDIVKTAIDTALSVKTDIPVCAVVFKNNEIISIQTNKKEENNSTIAHAEILALIEANQKLNNWRLDECSMFVTLEPCPMCMWAIISARIKNLYFGSYDVKYGAAISTVNLAKLANSKIKIQGGIKEAECDKILNDYFKRMRDEKNS